MNKILESYINEVSGWNAKIVKDKANAVLSQSSGKLGLLAIEVKNMLSISNYEGAELKELKSLEKTLNKLSGDFTQKKIR